MKRVLKLGGVWLLIIALLVACSGTNSAEGDESESSNGPVEITISAMRDTTGTMDKLIDDFNSSQSDIRVKFVETPASADDAHDTFATYLSAGDSSVDIYYVDVIWVAEFAEAGWSYPLDGFVTEDDRQDLIPAALEAFTYKDQLIAMPYYADGGMLYYRKDLLEKEGMEPPKDWNELVEQAQTLQEKYDVYGLTMQGAQYEGLICDLLEYVWGNGGDMLDDNNNVVINSPEAVEGLQFMSDLINKHKIAPEGTTTHQEDESLQLFTEGKAAFHRNWAYAWGVAQGEGSKIAGDVGIVPMVSAPGKEGVPVSTFGPQGYMISAFSEHPEEAWEFLNFLTSTDGQKEMLLGAGYTPTRESVYEDQEVMEEHPYLEQQLESFELAKPRPVHPFYPEMSDALQVQVHKALIGELSPKEALDGAKEKIEEIVQQVP